ncbi:MAG: hypothetical protein ACJ72N_24875 [Labedaea sp.]
MGNLPAANGQVAIWPLPNDIVTATIVENLVTSLIGRWRIVKMDLWDSDAIGLGAPGFVEFARDKTSEFGFIAVRGWPEESEHETSGPSARLSHDHPSSPPWTWRRSSP